MNEIAKISTLGMIGCVALAILCLLATLGAYHWETKSSSRDTPNRITQQQIHSSVESGEVNKLVRQIDLNRDIAGTNKSSYESVLSIAMYFFVSISMIFLILANVFYRIKKTNEQTR